MAAFIITLVVVIPLLGFLVWQFLQEARVQIESGHVGLLITRGEAQEKALEPGVHYVWPFRRQMIQDYSLREVSYYAADDDRADGPALEVDIGGNNEARLSYILRYRIDPAHLHEIHEYVGPHGIAGMVRDHAGQAIVEFLGSHDAATDNLYGSARRQLESQVRDHLVEQLKERGIVVVLFGIRDVELGTAGQVRLDIRRAKLELDREEARAAVRQARITNEIEQTRRLRDELDDNTVRYLQIEAWREYVDRWDGRGQLPLVLPGVGEGGLGGGQPRTVAEEVIDVEVESDVDEDYES